MPLSNLSEPKFWNRTKILALVWGPDLYGHRKVKFFKTGQLVQDLWIIKYFFKNRNFFFNDLNYKRGSYKSTHIAAEFWLDRQLQRQAAVPRRCSRRVTVYTTQIPLEYFKSTSHFGFQLVSAFFSPNNIFLEFDFPL